jgi:putative hemolysin
VCSSAKDLWLRDSSQQFSLKEMTRDCLYVPDSRAAERVLDDLRKTRAHMAVVLDEYGGTAGIITMEDLIEEVIGDIADEYDFAARTAIEADGVLELDGTMSLIDVRSDHRVQIPEETGRRLAVMHSRQLGRLPRMGDRVAVPGGELEVIAMDGRRIAALRVHRVTAGTTPQPAGARK